MQKIVVSFAVLTFVSNAGCSNKLSKEDAKVLLRDVAAAAAPTCSIYSGVARINPVVDEGNLTNENAEWVEFAGNLGFIENAHCPEPKGTELRCTATVKARTKCEEQPTMERMRMGIGYFARTCTFTMACGHGEVEVDSIVTEGARATIQYSLKAVVDPKFKAAESKPAAESRFRISGSQVEQRTAVAVLTDERKWILSK